ncbi:MAG: hypothetical protein D6744_07405 [Planctomycetota bacterium]|nr:MAG: hypothetical protein D6744_07405 [Planctomycetota bacterium]
MVRAHRPPGRRGVLLSSGDHGVSRHAGGQRGARAAARVGRGFFRRGRGRRDAASAVGAGDTVCAAGGGVTAMRSVWVIGSLAAAIALSGGCGYSADGLYRSGIDTVHVAMFDTHEFRRDLEFLLTEAVKKRISSDTPYRVVDRRNADTILKGELLEVRESAFAPDFATRQPRDKQMTMVVRMEWKDLRSGEILAERPLLLQAIDYLPPGGESDAFAERKVADRMAARIVAQMFHDDW